VPKDAASVEKEAGSNGVQNGAAKDDRFDEFMNYKRSRKSDIATKDATPQKASFIRLKPRSENGNASDEKVFDIVFSEDVAPGKKTIRTPDDKPSFNVEKIENSDKSHLMNKETAGVSKTELSLGYKLSPYSEILLGKGFLIERKESSSGLDSRDDGWRIRFKTDF